MAISFRKKHYFKNALRIFILTILLGIASNVFRIHAQYPKLPIPPSMLSPSNEEAQIVLEGIVRKVTLFHGKSDDEADWHIYISLSKNDQTTLFNHLKANNLNITHDLNEIYSELMVLDYYKNSLLDEKFYSADVTKPFLLKKQGSAHPAWDYGVMSTNDQGKNLECYSDLNCGRVYLQGAFVNDKEHQDGSKIERVEIHPLDAIAFAMDSSQKVFSSKYGQTGWPSASVKWRVAFFSNSKYHRINENGYVNKDRVTTFYLDLPNNAYSSTADDFTINQVANITVEQLPQEIWDGHRQIFYSGRQWKVYPEHTIAIDPKDGRKKLKVTATMKTPDHFGGIVVCDYLVTASFDAPVLEIEKRVEN